MEGRSIPRNRELMRVFKDLDLVEQLGSGMNRILKVYDKSIFKISEHFFEICFEYQEGFYNSNAIGGSMANNITDRQRDILDLIRQNPKISYRKIAQILDIADSAVKKTFKNP
jgi:predicted HTH transcriptional regulator